MVLGWGLNTTSTLDPSPTADLSIRSPKDISLALGLNELRVDDIVWTSWSCSVGYSAFPAPPNHPSVPQRHLPSLTADPELFWERTDRSSTSFLIWGFHPSTLHPDVTLPTRLSFPIGVVPKRFLGRESLEAVLGEDGVVYVPKGRGEKGGEDWRPALKEVSGEAEVPRFRDVAVMGTGEWVGVHGEPSEDLKGSLRASRNSKLARFASLSLADLNSSLIYSSPTLNGLLSIPLRSIQPPPGSPTFHTLLPSSSHCLALSDASPLQPLYGLGSNLHSQLSIPVSTAPVSASKPLPILADLLACGQITFASDAFSTAGVYTCAVSEMGQLFVWGGKWGTAEEAVEVDPCSEGEGEEEEDEDGREIVSAAVSSNGGVVCVRRDGNVWWTRCARAQGVEDGEGLLPKRRIEKAAGRREDEREFEKVDLREWGAGAGGGRKARRVVGASGGRGFFLVCD